MIKLSKEQIISMHHLLIIQSGGLDGIRDEGLLESAMNTPFQTFGDEELYPTIQKKAAVLCYGLVNNHAFIDGNKRIGILAMLVFLEINGIDINSKDKELVNLGLSIASNTVGVEDIIRWIINH